MNEEIQSVLNNVVTNLNSSVETNRLRPLGDFGDVTLNDLVVNAQNWDYSFFINNHEIILYPLKLVPAGLVYGTLVRSFMKHCDDYHSIMKERDISHRLHLLRIRRVNIATTLGVIIPIATCLILKIGRLSILDGISISINSNNIINNDDINNSLIPIFTILKNKAYFK